MIRFSCKCGQMLEVPDDQAGLTVQCTHCGLLRDIPTLSDLEHLSEFGTYLVEPPLEEARINRLKELREAFSREYEDDTGEEIDLRPTIEQVQHSGYIPTPQDDAAPNLPKYDPITGELVEPIQVQPQRLAPVESIPTARRVVSYATGGRLANSHTSGRIFVELFQPINLFVIFLIVVAHVVWEGLLIICSNPFFFVFLPVLFIATFLFFSHYGIVIEETGPNETDELPRPLRHLELGADLWWPAFHFAGAFLLCFWPAFLALAEMGRSPMKWPVFFVLLGLGTIFLPAVLLTLVTSGSELNLRPDRVVGVMIQCGMRYVWAVLVLPITVMIYLIGAVGGHAVILRHAVVRPGAQTWLTTPAIVYPMLVVGIYLMHYFCWHMGLMYREFHDQFPWVLQRHMPTRVMERSTPRGRREE